MKFLRIVPVVLLLFFCSGHKVYAQFPYDESFRNATAPGINFGGAPSAFLTAAGSSADGGPPIDPQGDGYLRLTSSAVNQKGYIYNDAAFPSYYGLKIAVEYFVRGGNGADGISFFLFDANVTPFVVGGFGGSLGYAPIQIQPTDPISPGVSKGYLAVGLDEYGNFSNPIQGRQGGIGFRPGSVTLRGKGDGDALVPSNYPFLTSVQTRDFGFDLVPGPGADRAPNPTDPNYRKVFIDMKPATGGYDITVKITVGGAVQTTYDIITNYHYDQPSPSLLRYGIASSTGDLTNFHEIRNVSIKVYDASGLLPATAVADVVTSCVRRNVSIDVTANDTTPNAGGSVDAKSVDLNPSEPGIQTSFVVANKGTFTVATNGIVTFTPLNATVTGPVTTRYTVKDNYGQESAPATITINDAPAPPSGTNAGSDVLLNVSAPGASAALAATLNTGQVGTWSQVAGPSTATISSISSRNTAVSELQYGVYTFRWSVTEGTSCDGIDDVNVVVNAIPVANNDNIATSVSTFVPIAILDNDTDANGNSTIDPTKVTIKGLPQNGTITSDEVAGRVIYRPNAGFVGSDSFLYTVKDNFGAESNTAVVTITISAKPVGTDDAMITLSNVPVSTNVKTNDITQTGTTVVKKTEPAHGTVTVNTTGPVTYVPATDYHGFDSFIYTLKNTAGLESDPIVVNVTVRPAAVNDASATSVNTPVSIAVKDNDPGKTGSIVVKRSDPLHGTAVVNTDGTVTYTPATDYQGSDTFTYLLRDLDGLESDLVNVTIVVRPVGTNDNVTTNLNTPVVIAVKDNDGSKTGTSVIKRTDPANGTATVNADNTVTYTPNATFQGTDTFTYLLRNADGADSNPITVTVVIRPRLVGSPDAALTKINTPVNVPVKTNDVNGPGNSAVKVTDPAHGTAVLNADGTFTYTPATDYYGPDGFTYRLRSPEGLESDPIPVVVGIRPTGTNDVYTTAQNIPLVLTVKDNDLSKTGTTVIRVTDPAHGTAVVNADGTVTYSPASGYTGTDVFTYLLRMADALESDPITVNINIKPIGTEDTGNTTINTAVVLPIKDNDPGKTGNTVVKKTDPQHGTVVVNPDGTVRYTPTTDYTGKDVFTYALRTPEGVESDIIPVTVNVKPTGTNDNAFTAVGVPVIVPVKTNDPGKTGTTVVKKTDPLHGTAVVNPDGTVTYTPTAGYRGPDTFTYTLRTPDGLESDPITVTLETRSQPVAGPDLVPVVTGQPMKINILGNDTGQDGPVDPTSVVITSPPLHGTLTVDPVTGEVTYTPFPGYTGPDSFVYTVKDAKGVESKPATVTITVTSPKIGLAKKLLDVKPALNGSYDVRYLFTVVNYSPFVLKNVSVKDDLLSVFNGAAVKVVKATHQGSFTLNPAFDGSTNIDLLVPATSTLSALGEEQIELTVNIRLISREGIFQNSAVAEAYNDLGVKVTDQSTDGLRPDPTATGDVSPSVTTPVDLRINAIFIPGGFSPNNDGINDYFVIQNTLDKPVSFEVYNRWANLVYKSSNYQNDWNGKTTQGVHIGDEVPAGTYHYIIVIEGKKYVGYITINR